MTAQARKVDERVIGIQNVASFFWFIFISLVRVRYSDRMYPRPPLFFLIFESDDVDIEGVEKR